MRLDVGDRYGRLTVIAASSGKNRGRHWLVRCDCGTEKVVRESNMISNKRPTVSCGCYARSMSRPWTATASLIHGHTKRNGSRKQTSEYGTWQSMIRRCTVPGLRDYKNYGGRGITVCERWRTSFADFLSDMGTKPSVAHSIDRIDNDGNYEPGNCRWATRADQSVNRRNVKMTASIRDEARSAFASGETTRQLAERFGVSIDSIQRVVYGRKSRAKVDAMHGALEGK